MRRNFLNDRTQPFPPVKTIMDLFALPITAGANNIPLGVQITVAIFVNQFDVEQMLLSILFMSKIWVVKASLHKRFEVAISCLDNSIWKRTSYALTAFNGSGP